MGIAEEIARKRVELAGFVTADMHVNPCNVEFARAMWFEPKGRVQ